MTRSSSIFPIKLVTVHGISNSVKGTINGSADLREIVNAVIGRALLVKLKLVSQVGPYQRFCRPKESTQLPKNAAI